MDEGSRCVPRRVSDSQPHQTAIPRDEARPLRWSLALGVFTLTLAVYLPSIHFGFINWDDPDYFSSNPNIRDLSPANLSWMLTTTHMGHYQPINWLSYALDHRLGGLDPGRFHLTQIILHALAALCLISVTDRLIRIARPKTHPSLRALAAAFAALLFALHPLRVESVAWLSARADIPATIFSLLAVRAYLKHSEDAARSGPASRWLPISLICYILAVASKEMAVTLPAILIVLDIYPLRRLPVSPRTWTHERFRPLWLEKAAFLIIAAIIAVVAFRAAGADTVASLAEHPLPVRVAQAAVSLMFYIQKTLTPGALSPLIEFPIGFGLTHSLAIWSLAALAVLAIAIWLARHKAPGLAAAAVCYLIVLLPVSGLTQRGPQMVADRYSYMACLPWAVAAAFLFARLFERYSRVVIVAAIGLCSLMVVRTRTQLTYWEDSERLWRHALVVDPTSGGAHAHLAHALASRGESEAAVEGYRRALALGWRHFSVHRNLAALLQRMGRDEEAIPEYLADIAEYPGRWESQFYLGAACERTGDPARAAEAYRQALEIEPGLTAAHVALGRLFMEHEHFPEAETRLRYALSREPEQLEALERLAILCARSNRYEEAVALLDRCIQAADRQNLTTIALALRERREAYLSAMKN